MPLVVVVQCVRQNFHEAHERVGRRGHATILPARAAAYLTSWARPSGPAHNAKG